MSQRHKEKLVQVYRARNEGEAQIIKSKLESFGIPSLLKSHSAFSALPFAVDGLGEVKIMVAEENAEEAKAILAEEQNNNGV